MTQANRSPADVSAPPEREVFEVRRDGHLLKRLARGVADTLISRGWGEWVGSGRRRYVCLTDSAPLSALYSWPGRNDGTRPLRGQSGQFLGAPDKLREFIPLK
jgi:hypothetical protein